MATPADRVFRRVAAGLALVLVISLLPAGVVPTGVQPVSAGGGPHDPCNDIVLTSSTTGRYINRPGTVVQMGTPVGPICRIEQKVLAALAAERDVHYTRTEQERLLSWGRDDVRGRLFAELLRIIASDSRTADEQAAYGWFQARVRNLRIKMAETSKAEYQKWERDKCGYAAPSPFHYDAACTSSLLSLFTGPPLPPSYEEFVGYGAYGATADMRLEQNQVIAGRAARAVDTALVTALAGALTVGVGATAAASAMALGATMGAILPHATHGFALGVGGVAGPIAIVLLMVIIAVVRGQQVFDAAAIPGRLDDDLTRAQALPDLRDFVTNERDLAILFTAFIDATLPDYPAPANGPAAPTDAAGATSAFLVRSPGSDGPQYRQAIDYVYQVNGQRRLDRAWIDSGWWVIEPGSGGPNRLERSLTYLDHDGNVATAAIVGDEFLVFNASQMVSKYRCPEPYCRRTRELQIQVPDPGPGAVSKATATLTDMVGAIGGGGPGDGPSGPDTSPEAEPRAGSPIPVPGVLLVLLAVLFVVGPGTRSRDRRITG